METLKDKRHSFVLVLFWPAICGRVLMFIAFLCTSNSLLYAQNNVIAVAQTSVTKKLSGLYSSKNSKVYPQPEQLSSVALPEGFPVNKPDYKEVVDKRKENSRTYTDGKGGIVVQTSSKHLNYIDKTGVYKPIDPRLKTINTQNGLQWASLEQQFPVHLYADGSTALSSDKNDKIIFNRNCGINSVNIDLSDYTVGEEGAFINNVIAGINKKIVFAENRVETDYIIPQPLHLNEDLKITEEIVLPAGCRIQAIAIKERDKSGNSVGEEYVVYSSDNKEQARFRIPVFYDANKSALFGKYNLVQHGDKYILGIIVPAQWLNDPARAYPITVDPVVTGPTSNYPSVFMDSCVLPVYKKDSMLVTIPAGVTITGFIVQDSYFADAQTSPAALMKHGKMMLSTVCGAVTFACQGTAADSSGTCYLVPNTDLKTNLACCFMPSCSAETFYITHGLGRDSYGPGCNQTYIYYSPLGNWPFSAYIIGKTVETTQVQWSVFPTTVCSDSCTIYLKATTKHGVPPYTITHPWATGSHLYGDSDGCNSLGSDTIPLSLPGCPSTCNTNTTLDIPPPVITDACGDTIAGLTSKSITIKPVPVASVSTTDVCSNEPFTFTSSSCVAGSTFQWTGSNGSAGSGDVNDVIQNADTVPVVVNYTVIPTANGCTGDAVVVPVEVNPLPIITVESVNDTIDPGVSTPLDAIGGLTYQWQPSLGLSCSNCPTPLAGPSITTQYVITGTNEYGCSGKDTIEIYVNQGTEVLYIPNSFTPNENDINDLFCVYGSSIKKINIRIYDRWGELLFNSNDLNLGWDGKYKGTDVVDGIYVYSVTCEWMSGTHTRRNGTITVIR